MLPCISSAEPVAREGARAASPSASGLTVSPRPRWDDRIQKRPHAAPAAPAVLAASHRSSATVRSAPVVISASDVPSEWATLYFDAHGRRVHQPTCASAAARSMHASSNARSEAAEAAAEVAAVAATGRFECPQQLAEPAGAGHMREGSDCAGKAIELRISAADGSCVSPVKQRTLGLKGGGSLSRSSLWQRALAQHSRAPKLC